MKATAILIALFPVLCFAQKAANTTDVKSTTDACPTFKNVKQPSKAEYFKSLRTGKKTQHTELAYNSPKTIPTKKQPAERPAAQKQTAYVPSFSTGTDVAMKPEKTIPEKSAVPAEQKESIKPEAAEKAVSTAGNEKAKTKVKRKAAKKQSNCSSVKKVKTSKRNNEKCPAF